MNKIQLELSVESKFYGNLTPGVERLGIKKNIPDYAITAPREYLGDEIAKVVPDWTYGEDPIDCFSEEEQQKIKERYKWFKENHTEVTVSPSDINDELHKKAFTISFVLRNEDVQKFTEEVKPC